MKRKRDSKPEKSMQNSSDIDTSNILTSERRSGEQRLKDDDKKKEIDAIYSGMEAQIQRINELLWYYIPLTSAVCPKESIPKNISDFYDRESGNIDLSQIGDDCIVKFRIRGFGKRYFNLTAIKDPNDRIKILQDIRSIHHPSISQANRRLDAIARLLEGCHICVAVYRKKDNTLLITANDIDNDTLPKTIANGALIADVMRYFTNPNTKLDRVEIFNRICLASVKSSDKSGIKISNATIERISDYLLNDQQGGWKALTIPQLLEIATDNTSITDPLESGDIIRAFFMIDNLARDFRKVENFFSQESQENFSFEILRVGNPNVHAELRMIDYLLKNQEITFVDDTHYIGISRLCCAKCELAIKTINFTMKENKTIGKDIIEIRGEHGIGADDTKWQKPDFLNKRKIDEFPQKIHDYLLPLLHRYAVFSTCLKPAQGGQYLQKAEMYRKVLGILDLKEGNAVNSLMKKYTFFGCIHQLLCDTSKPNVDKKKKKEGFYLYRTETSPEKIYVLVIHDKNIRETLDLTSLAKGNQKYEENLENIEWPISTDAKVQFDDELVKLIISSCKHPHFLSNGAGVIIPIKWLLSNRDRFLSDTSISFVSLYFNGKERYLDLRKLRDTNMSFSEIYRDLFIINHLLVNQEKKPVSQRASQSSSDEEMEIEMTIKGILKKLDNIVDTLTAREHSKLVTTDALFLQEVYDVLRVTLQENPSKDRKNYIEIIKNAKGKIQGLSKIDEKELTEIMQTLYNTYIPSVPQSGIQSDLDDKENLDTIHVSSKEMQKEEKRDQRIRYSGLSVDSPLNTAKQPSKKRDKKPITEQKQYGWNCFDIAVDLMSKLEAQIEDPTECAILTRQRFIEYVIAHKDDITYRQLLASEIKHAAALTVTYMIIQESKDAAEIERAIQLEELFQLQIAIDSDDTYNQYLIKKNIEQLLHNKSLLQFPNGSLPVIMRTEELKNVVLDYQDMHEQIKPIVAQCNQLVDRREGNYFSYQELTNYFTIRRNQLAYPEAFEKFKEAQEIFSPCEQAFNDFCERVDIYENYVNYYYGVLDSSRQGGWFAFQRKFTKEESTSMIDIAALFLKKQIIIKNSSDVIVYESIHSFDEKIEIRYNGTNHFSAISNTSSVSDRPAI